MLPLQVFGPGGVLDQLVAGAGRFAAQAITFVVTAAIVYLVGRIVVVPIVRRALRARDVEPTLAKPAVKGTLALVVFVAFAIAFAVAGFGNLVSGVFLISDPKLKIGDWVEWDGNAGIVEDISFRVSRVRTFNNELITVPNSDLTNTAVTNPVAKDTLRIPFTFGVGYDDDLDHAKAVIVEEAETHDEILDDPAPSVRVTELADSYVGIQSRFWIDDPARSDFVRVKSEYVQAVKERCDAEAIDMPYPYQELTGSIEVENTGGAPADD